MNSKLHHIIVTVQGCYQVLMRQSGIFNLLINAHYSDGKNIFTCYAIEKNYN
jgi:hypothetical protein